MWVRQGLLLAELSTLSSFSTSEQVPKKDSRRGCTGKDLAPASRTALVQRSLLTWRPLRLSLSLLSIYPVHLRQRETLETPFLDRPFCARPKNHFSKGGEDRDKETEERGCYFWMVLKAHPWKRECPLICNSCLPHPTTPSSIIRRHVGRNLSSLEPHCNVNRVTSEHVQSLCLYLLPFTSTHVWE